MRICGRLPTSFGLPSSLFPLGRCCLLGRWRCRGRYLYGSCGRRRRGSRGFLGDRRADVVADGVFLGLEHHVARHCDLAAVKRNVAMDDELPGLLHGVRIALPEDDSLELSLQQVLDLEGENVLELRLFLEDSESLQLGLDLACFTGEVRVLGDLAGTNDAQQCPCLSPELTQHRGELPDALLVP